MRDVLDNGLPISEAEFMALDFMAPDFMAPGEMAPGEMAPGEMAPGETAARTELWDGNLIIRPRETPRHQRVLSALASALRAGRADLNVLSGVNVRLAPDRVVIPDLVVTGAIDLDEPIIDAVSVRLVVEVVSPISAFVDHTLKMHGYAAAGIPWYLLVEQGDRSLHGHLLVGDAYVEKSVMQLESLL